MKMYGDLNETEKNILRDYNIWKKLDCFHPAFTENMFEYKLFELIRLRKQARVLNFEHLCF